MKKAIYQVLIAATVGLVSLQASAQQKIKDGTVTGSPSLPHAGAIQELESTDKGQLLPRVALASTTVWGLGGTAVAGMQVFNTNATIVSGDAKYPVIEGNTLPATKGTGVYYWDGFGWVGTNYYKDVTSAAGYANPILIAHKQTSGEVATSSSAFTLNNFTETRDATSSFDPLSGVFTAPIAATYTFSVNTIALFSDNISAPIALSFLAEKALAATPTTFNPVINPAFNPSLFGNGYRTASFFFYPTSGFSAAYYYTSPIGYYPVTQSFTTSVQLQAGDKFRFTATTFNNAGGILFNLGVSSMTVNISNY